MFTGGGSCSLIYISDSLVGGLDQASMLTSESLFVPFSVKMMQVRK